MKDKIEVFPGDEVAVEEEYLAAEGTFAKDGKIYASQIGLLELNDEECIARVISPNPPNILKIGDVVYAVVADIRKTMATADVVAKAAKVQLLEIRIARGLGGKGFLVFTGEVSSVRSAVKACANALGETGEITSHCVIASPHKDLVKQVLAQ